MGGNSFSGTKGVWKVDNRCRQFKWRERVLISELRERQQGLTEAQLEDGAFNVYIFISLLIKSLCLQVEGPECAGVICSTLLLFSQLALLLRWNVSNLVHLAGSCIVLNKEAAFRAPIIDELHDAIKVALNPFNTSLVGTSKQLGQALRYAELHYAKTRRFFVSERPLLPCFSPVLRNCGDLIIPTEVCEALEKVSAAVLVDLYCIGLGVVFKAEVLAACAVYWTSVLLSLASTCEDFVSRSKSAKTFILFSDGPCQMEHVASSSGANVDANDRGSLLGRQLLRAVIRHYSASRLDLQVLLQVSKQLLYFSTFLKEKFDPVQALNNVALLGCVPKESPIEKQRLNGFSVQPFDPYGAYSANLPLQLSQINIFDGIAPTIPSIISSNSGSHASHVPPMSPLVGVTNPRPPFTVYTDVTAHSRSHPFHPFVDQASGQLLHEHACNHTPLDRITKEIDAEMEVLDSLLTDQEIRSIELQILRETQDGAGSI